MKVYVVCEAIHLIGTANEYDFDDLAARAFVRKTREEAEECLRNLIFKFCKDYLVAAEKTYDLSVDAACASGVIFREGKIRANPDTWAHEYCDRSAVWRISESEIAP